MISEVSALYDPLTGLAGRALFHDRLDLAMARARRNTCSAALMLLDIDGFAAVNERHGHDAGDQLLRTVASRLSVSLRATDTVGRLEVDRFGILLEDMLVVDNVTIVASKVLNQFADPFPIGGESLRVSASLGVATYPQCASKADALFGRAGVALRRAKARPGNAYEIHPPEGGR